VLLAHMGEAVIAAYCARPLRHFTDRTITSAKRLTVELARCRAQGYAINLGELDADIGAVSSVVVDRRAKVVGAVTATVPMYRFDASRQSELADRVRRCALELSAKLGPYA